MFQESTCEFKEDSQKLQPQNTMMETDPSQYTRDCSTGKRQFREHSRKSMDQQWCDISEVIESDFLISPGDIYPNRKVELEDADIKNSTKASFELLCEQQHEAFSKNNKDIGST